MELREYQKEAIKATYSYLRTGQGHAPIIEVFTGGGKSLIMAQIIKDMLKHGRRVLSVTHVRELIKQNFLEFTKLCPLANATIFSAGLSQKDYRGDVVFAGIQSFYSKTHLCKPFDLILIDECDLVSPNDRTRYNTLINVLKLANPNIKIIGLTATPYRMDSGYIYTGKGAVFDGVSYGAGYKQLLDLGYLAPIITKQAAISIDTTSVGKRGGEYIEHDLAIAASKDDLVKSSVAEIVEAGKDRKKWLVFATGIAHAELLRQEFKTHGIIAECVNGKTKKNFRDKTNNDFIKGGLRCLISVGTHTTGFNCPAIDLIAIVRATMSTRLMVQMIGRGVRIAPDKENLLLLDFGNNIVCHGFLDDLRINEKTNKSKEKEEPRIMAKECPRCKSIIKIQAVQCPDCGYLQEREFKHQVKAYEGAVLKEDHEAVIYDREIHSVMYSIHRKVGKAPIIKVLYVCGLDYIYDWICLHDDLDGLSHLQKESGKEFGIAKVKKLGGKAETLSQAQKEWDSWKAPAWLSYKMKGKFKNIEAVYFDEKKDSVRA